MLKLVQVLVFQLISSIRVLTDLFDSDSHIHR